jgi:hypothetical protein
MIQMGENFTTVIEKLEAVPHSFLSLSLRTNAGENARMVKCIYKYIHFF